MQQLAERGCCDDGCTAWHLVESLVQTQTLPVSEILGKSQKEREALLATITKDREVLSYEIAHDLARAEFVRRMNESDAPLIFDRETFLQDTQKFDANLASSIGSANATPHKKKKPRTKKRRPFANGDQTRPDNTAGSARIICYFASFALTFSRTAHQHDNARSISGFSQAVNRAVSNINATIRNLARSGVPVVLGIAEHVVASVPAVKYVQVLSPGVPATSNANATLFSALIAAHTAGYAMDCSTQQPVGYREEFYDKRLFTTLR